MAISFFWISGLLQTFLPLYNTSKTFGSRYNRSPEIFNTFVLLSLISLLFGLFLFLFKNSISGLLLNGKEIPFLNYLILYTIINNPTFLIEHIYLIKNKSTHIVAYGSISYLLQIIIVGLPPILGCPFIYSIYGLLVISTARYIWLVILLMRYSKFQISFRFIKEHIRVALPLILSIFLSGSAQYIDGFLISHYYNEAKFAIFRYGARELPIAVLIADAFSNAMLPEVAGTKDMKKMLRKIKDKSKRYMHFLFPLTILLIISSNWFYPKVFNTEFSESAKIFNIYLLLIISRLLFPQTILIGLKKNGMILLASISELVINVVLSIIFIQYFGIVGVAIATVIAFFAERIILIGINASQGRNPGEYIPLGWFFSYSIITILAYLFVDYNLFNLL